MDSRGHVRWPYEKLHEATSTCFNQTVYLTELADLNFESNLTKSQMLQSLFKFHLNKSNVSEGGAFQVRSGLRKPLKYQNVHASRVQFLIKKAKDRSGQLWALCFWRLLLPLETNRDLLMNETNEEGEGSFQRTPPVWLSLRLHTLITIQCPEGGRSKRLMRCRRRGNNSSSGGAMVVAVWISMKILKAWENSPF